MLYKIPDHMLKDKCNCSSPFTAVLSIRNSNLSEFCQTSWIHRRMVLLLCSHHISNKHICKWKDNAKEAVHQNIDYKKNYIMLKVVNQCLYNFFKICYTP